MTTHEGPAVSLESDHLTRLLNEATAEQSSVSATDVVPESSSSTPPSSPAVAAPLFADGDTGFDVNSTDTDVVRYTVNSEVAARRQPQLARAVPQEIEDLRDESSAESTVEPVVALKRHSDEPTQGWPKLLGTAYRKLSREHPDHPGYFMFAKPNQVEYRERLILRLKQLSDMGIMPVLGFALGKSTAKTTTSIGVGNVVAHYTRKRSVIIPATNNTATATVGLMAGIKGGRSITVSEFMANAALYDTPRKLESRLPTTRWGLAVIAEDEASSHDEDDNAKTQQFMEMVDTVLPNVGGTIILDFGNDNISRWGIALQSARLAHVLNHPFVVDSPVSYEALTTTMEGLNSNNGEIPSDVWQRLYESFANRHDTGLNMPVRDKVAASVVVATKATGGVDFQSVTNSQKSNGHLEWNGTGLYVPKEPSFGRKDDHNRLVPFDLDAIKRQTEIGYLEIAVANFELAGLRMDMDIGDLMVANVPTEN